MNKTKTVVLWDGGLMEEVRFERISAQVLGVFFAHTSAFCEFAKFCLRTGKFVRQSTTEKDLGGSTQKVLKRAGLMKLEQGASIPQPNGEIHVYLHEIVSEEVRQVVITLLKWRESPLHKVDVLVPDEKTRKHKVNLKV